MFKLALLPSFAAVYADVSQGLQYTSSLLYFVLVGKIPGTDHYIAPDTMLLLWASITIAVLFIIIALQAARRIRTNNVAFSSN